MSPNHIFSVLRNTIKHTIALFDIVIMQNIKLSPSSSIIEVETRLFLKTHMCLVSRNTIKHAIQLFDITYMQS